MGGGRSVVWSTVRLLQRNSTTGGGVSFPHALRLIQRSVFMSALDPSPSGSAEREQELSVIKERLREALPRLQDKYAVTRLVLHGSRVCGEANPDSALDVLVDVADVQAGRRVSLLDCIAWQHELDAFLDVPVDLGERAALQGMGANTFVKRQTPSAHAFPTPSRTSVCNVLPDPVSQPGTVSIRH